LCYGAPRLASFIVSEQRFRFDHSFEPRNNGLMDSADSRPRLPSRWAGVGAKLPPALEQLVGPVDGVVELPLDLAWSGDRRFDLADPVQRYLYHMTVLTSAVTREHYTLAEREPAARRLVLQRGPRVGFSYARRRRASGRIASLSSSHEYGRPAWT
jgi:hypothetical protein